MSCTRNEIKLWTVNGELLASTELAITANNRLLCCTMSEVSQLITPVTTIISPILIDAGVGHGQCDSDRFQ